MRISESTRNAIIVVALVCTGFGLGSLGRGTVERTASDRQQIERNRQQIEINRVGIELNRAAIADNADTLKSNSVKMDQMIARQCPKAGKE